MLKKIICEIEIMKIKLAFVKGEIDIEERDRRIDRIFMEELIMKEFITGFFMDILGRVVYYTSYARGYVKGYVKGSIERFKESIEK